ncbi:MAG: hypothetical protein ACLP5H_09960 [Desulfomonilaceae bacterium]
MKDRSDVILDIHQDVQSLTEPLCAVADLVEFFSDDFNEEMAHDDSQLTRKRLRTITTTLLKDLDELFRVLTVIDPDLVLEWKLGYLDFEDSDAEESPSSRS